MENVSEIPWYTTEMYEDAADAWTTWLRDSSHKQGRSALKRVCTSEHDDVPQYCCLGGLCEVAISAGVPVRASDKFFTTSNGTKKYLYDGHADVLPASVSEWAGLTKFPESDPKLGAFSATIWNDVEKKSFSEIADLIDKHVKRIPRPAAE